MLGLVQFLVGGLDGGVERVDHLVGDGDRVAGGRAAQLQEPGVAGASAAAARVSARRTWAAAAFLAVLGTLRSGLSGVAAWESRANRLRA